MSEIYLAGGCFWGLERALEDLPGIVSTQCGYANGDPHLVPDYMLVCSGRFGYRETVRVEYDPGVMRLEDLLAAFLFLIDPTQERRQGNDVGIQYQTGVYWTDEASGEVVRRVLADAAPAYPEFHVECGPLMQWSPAEEYHQRYLDRNPGGYCHIQPWKMAALRELLSAGKRARLPINNINLFICNRRLLTNSKKPSCYIARPYRGRRRYPLRDHGGGDCGAYPQHEDSRGREDRQGGSVRPR